MAQVLEVTRKPRSIIVKTDVGTFTRQSAHPYSAIVLRSHFPVEYYETELAKDLARYDRTISEYKLALDEHRKWEANPGEQWTSTIAYPSLPDAIKYETLARIRCERNARKNIADAKAGRWIDRSWHRSPRLAQKALATYSTGYQPSADGTVYPVSYEIISFSVEGK